MSDLGTQLRAYLDETAPPVELEEIFTEPVGAPPVQPLRPRTPRSRFPGWAYAIAAAMIVLVALGATAWLTGALDDSRPVVDDPSPTTVIPSPEPTAADLSTWTWQSVSPPRDLTEIEAFGSGFVAATRAEIDGSDEFIVDIWISPDGASWNRATRPEGAPNRSEELGWPGDSRIGPVQIDDRGVLWWWEEGIPPSRAWRSEDGIVWQEVELDLAGWQPAPISGVEHYLRPDGVRWAGDVPVGVFEYGSRIPWIQIENLLALDCWCWRSVNADERVLEWRDETVVAQLGLSIVGSGDSVAVQFTNPETNEVLHVISGPHDVLGYLEDMSWEEAATEVVEGPGPSGRLTVVLESSAAVTSSTTPADVGGVLLDHEAAELLTGQPGAALLDDDTGQTWITWDGSSWHQGPTMALPAGAQYVPRVVGGRFVAVDYQDFEGVPKYWTSSDGVSWVPVSVSMPSDFTGRFGSESGLSPSLVPAPFGWVLTEFTPDDVGSGGDELRVWISSDANQWRRVDEGRLKAEGDLHALVVGDAVFVDGQWVGRLAGE